MTAWNKENKNKNKKCIHVRYINKNLCAPG
jgi:hypothetical protein